MRIGFLGPFGSTYNSDYGSQRQIGAIEYQIFGLAKELSSLGHQVFVTRNWKGGDQKTSIQDVTFLNVDFLGSIEQGFHDSVFPLNRLSSAYYLSEGPKRLCNLNLDIVNVSRVISGWIALRQIRSYKSHGVYTTHDNDIYFGGALGHSRFPFLTKNLLQRVIKNYDASVATTISVEKYLKNHGLHCHRVISEAIDPDLYRYHSEEGFVLTASRLVPHKRVEDLIDAYSRISDNVREDLVIIGSGPHERQLKNFANTLACRKRIHFVPFLPKSKYRDYLSKCSVFVLPSVSEAFGLVILEAMASGKPVVARRTIGPQDIINDGFNGLLFVNNGELATQLERLLLDKDLRRRIGTNAKRTVDEEHTFAIIAKQYLQLYKQLAE